MVIPNDLEEYQITITADTLYYAKNSGRGTERQSSILAVSGGTVNIYGSLSKPVSIPGDMILDECVSPFSGIDGFGVVPTYIYIQTVTGTPIITASSIEVQEVV